MKNKVAWRQLAPYMQCALIPSEIEIALANYTVKRKIILNNTVYFLVEDSEERSLCLAGFLNSTPIRVFLQSFSAKYRGGWFKSYSWAIGLVPIPLDAITKIFSRLQKSIPQQEELDKLVGTLYGLTDKEIDEMRIFHEQITSHITKSEEQ